MEPPRRTTPAAEPGAPTRREGLAQKDRRSEVAPRTGDRARPGRRGALAAALVAVVALLGWAALRDDQQALTAGPQPVGTMPLPPTSSGTQSSIQRPPDWPYLLDLSDGSRTPLPRRLAPGNGAWPVYATRPGTREVALATCPLTVFGCSGPGAITLTSLEHATVATVPIPEGLVPQGVSVSPDGGSLLYPATDGTRYAVPELYLYDLATSQTRRLTDIPLESAWWWSLQPSFSSDGRTVLYDLPRTGRQQTRWDVWAVPVGGGPATRMVRDAKGPRAIPGTSDLAVLTPRESLWEGAAIEIVTAAGARRTLVESASGIGPIQASPDGRRLAYSEDATGAWVVEIASGRRTRLGDGGVGTWIDAGTVMILP